MIRHSNTSAAAYWWDSEELWWWALYASAVTDLRPRLIRVRKKAKEGEAKP